MTASSNSTIAIFLPSLEQGGAERRMCLLAVGLKERGHNVEVVVLRKKGMFIKTLEQSNIVIKSVEKGGRWDLLGAFYRTYKLFTIKTYSTVFSCLPSANLFSVMSKLANRKAKLVWGIAVADLPIAQYGLWAKLGYTLQKILSIFPDQVVVNSAMGKKSAISQGFSEKKLSLIRNGIDIEQFYFDKQNGEQYRQEWRLKNDIPVEAYLIGLIGRLDPAKGIEIFLEAANKSLNTEFHFVIIGSGSDDYANTLKLEIQKHVLFNSRLFLVKNEQVSLQTYHAIDLLTVASVSEGLPNVLLESLACGKRVVSTDVGDCRVVLDGHGHIIPSSNIQAMLDAWDVEFKYEYNNEDVENYLKSSFTVSKMVDDFESLLMPVRHQDKGIV